MMRKTAVRAATTIPPKSQAIIANEAKFSASNYAPLPVVFSKASKSTVL
eukprot:CAMPEP_0174852904 /NCGR_PEP_ID=MMETSP1114-20130205/27262_1 /TAXON_ID=312471 /ORGANISM="Neobodo designis, Strain CCAP 1951/1" /LENGTH=48 /DNA_ID= /DNA_START= /DNA_END= /DNA_ORIENTATION=